MGITQLVQLSTTQPMRTDGLSLPAKTSYLIFKRACDIIIAALALLVLSPLMAIIALAIKLDSPGPVIFSQQRVRGRQNPDEPHPERHVFAFYKFRSMAVNCDPALHRAYVTHYMNGHCAEINNGSDSMPVYKMKHDPRITRVGRLLRRTSLDELPQLVNILKGDMSLVGPRPALPYEVEQYATHHRLRLVPHAGLTGLWQVSGRTTLSFEQMICLDIEYARSRSFLLDLEILVRTIPAILSAAGAW